MAGMVHANDVRIAEGLREMELPADPALAVAALGARAERRGRELASGRGLRHPRLQRSRGPRHQRAHGLLLPALLRVAHVQQRIVVPLPSAGAGGDADGDLVAHPFPGGQRAREANAARAVGDATIPGGHRSRRRTSRTCRGSNRACTPRASSTCDCRSRWRATSRTSTAPSTASSPGCLTRAAPGAADGQREPARASDRRHRLRRMSDLSPTSSRASAPTIAAYTQALDDGRTDDVVGHVLPDGVCEIPGMGTHVGPRRAACGLRRMEAGTAAASRRRQHASSPTGTITRRARSAT